MSDTKPFRVLFVCIGNSCRSPMAEAIARAKYGDIMEASSAGIAPAAIIQPETERCLQEGGYQLFDDMRPEALTAVDWGSMDVIVNMSGAGILPLIQGYRGGNLIWEVQDPMGRPLEAYRQARERIERQLERLAETLRAHAAKPDDEGP
jgi:arsenate reductase